MVMTGLTEQLETSGMLLIDDLHAFDFVLDAGELRIECMDGRELKRWHFTAAQIAAANFDETQQFWAISNDKGSYRLVCLSAFSPSDEDDEQE